MSTSATSAAAAAVVRAPGGVSRGPRRGWWVAFGALLAFDNVPLTYGISGLTTGGPGIIAIVGLLLLMRERHSTEERRLWRWSASVAVLAVVSVSVSLVRYQAVADVFSISIGSDLAIVKAGRTAVIVALWVAAAAIGIRAAKIDVRIPGWIGAGLLAVAIPMLLLQWVGVLDPAASDWAHALAWREGRPRGMKFESSVFGASLVAGYALVVLGRPARRAWWWLPGLGLAVYLSTSRGAQAAVVLGACLTCVFVVIARRRGGSVAWVVPAMVVVVAAWLSFLGITLVTSPWWAPLASGASDASRTGWGLAAMSSLGHAPYGLDLFTYWFEVQAYLADAYATIATAYPVTSLQEFVNLATAESDSGLSPKTLPALCAMWFGWPGLVAVLALLGWAGNRALQAYRTFRTGVLLGTTLVIVSLASFVPGIFVYETALALGAAVGLGGARQSRRTRGAEE